MGPPVQKEIPSLETIIIAVYLCEILGVNPPLTATEDRTKIHLRP